MQLPHLDSFLHNLLEMRYSRETVYNYGRDLKVFEGFINNELRLQNFSEFSKDGLQIYKEYLNSTKRRTAKNEVSKGTLDSQSVNRLLSSLRRYLSYLVEDGYNVPVLSEEVVLIRTKRKPAIKILTGELLTIVEAPTKFEDDEIVAKRNRAMLELIFATGIRISELIAIDRSQVSKEKIFIQGKNGVGRFVQLTFRSSKYLTEYLETRRDHQASLFLPYRGRNVRKKSARISDVYLQTKIKEYRSRLGISSPISAHSLRYGFFMTFIEQITKPTEINQISQHDEIEAQLSYLEIIKICEDTIG